MKNTAILFITIFVCACSLAAAEEQQQDTHQPDMQKSDGEHSGMMGGNKMGMKSGMMVGMHPTVVATSDGGVVVLTGGKLAKYDNQLNLVKEVEIKGGPKPINKKSEPMEMIRPPAPTQNEAASQASPEESSALPASEASSVKE